MFAAFLLYSGNVMAQYAKLLDSKKYSKTEVALFSSSVAYFENADYTNAYVGFSQLHSWYPSDPVFSYYCGVSMVQLRTDYDKAIKYLTLARENNLYEADLYIGMAYHRKYFFLHALEFYGKYRDYIFSASKGRSPKISEVDALSNDARKAKSLAEYSAVLKVISNSKVKRGNFHFSYGRKILDGNLVVKPDFFKMKHDKNIKDVDLVYVLDTIALVSTYGDDTKNGLDIYVSYRKDDSWGPLEPLKGSINTRYDEAFPFLAPDGTLYFASKGHNSIGGYDIFRARYNETLGQWENPENLGFPINTPYDDFMFAIESNEQSAFFASDRYSKDGLIMVCRYIFETNPEMVKIDREDDIAEKAELVETPGAEKEYEKRVEKHENQEVKDDDTHEESTPLDTADMLVQSKDMLGNKIEAVDSYKEYAQNLNAYNRVTSERIKRIRAGEEPGMSTEELTEMANDVVFYYDLAQKFSSVYSVAAPNLEYCSKEMDALSKLDAQSEQYVTKLSKLNATLEKINSKSPIDALLEEKTQEKKQAEVACNRFTREIADLKDELNNLNERLSTKMLLLERESDPAIRENYINEHKTLENTKLDIITSIKSKQVDVKRLKMVIAKNADAIEKLQGLDEMLASVNYSEGKRLGDIKEEDVLQYKAFVEDEEAKLADEYEREVDEDESMYSEIIDYSQLASPKTKQGKTITEDILAYRDYVSDATSEAIDMMVETDSLYSYKSDLEARFDGSDSDEEKASLIKNINSIQTQIERNERSLDEELQYSDSDNSMALSAISEFGSLRQQKVDSEDWNELVGTTQSLIEKSRELEKKYEYAAKNKEDLNDKGPKLVERIKSDVDDQIVANVEEMKSIVASVKTRKNNKPVDLISEIEKIKQGQQSVSADNKEISEDARLAEDKIREAKKSNDAENVIVLAEQYLNEAVEKRVTVLAKEYENEINVYETLTEKYGNNITPADRKKVENVYLRSQTSIDNSEKAANDEEKMLNLSDACLQIKEANSLLTNILSSGREPVEVQSDELTHSLVTLREEIDNLKQNIVHDNNDANSLELQGRDIIADLKTSADRQNAYEAAIAEKGDEINNIEQHMPTASKSAQKQLQSDLKTASEQRNTTARELGEEKETFYREIDRTSGKTLSSNSDYTARYHDFSTALNKLKNSDEAIVETNLENSEKSELALLKTMLPNVDSDTRSILQPIYDKLEEKYGTDTRSHEEGLISQLRNSVKAQDKYTALVAEKGDEISNIEQHMPTASKSAQKQLQSDLKSASEQRNTTARELGEEKETFYREIDRTSGKTLSSNSDYTARYQDFNTALNKLKNSDEAIVETNLENSKKSELALLKTMLPNVDSDTRSILQPIHDKLEEKYGAGNHDADSHDIIADLKTSADRQNAYEAAIAEKGDEISNIEQHLPTASKSAQKQLQSDLKTASEQRNTTARELGEEKETFYREIDRTSGKTLSSNSDYTARYQDFNTALYKLKNSDEAIVETNLENSEKSELALLKTMLTNVDSDTRSILQPIHDKLEEKYGTDTRSHEEGLISQLRNSVKAQDKYTALIEEKGDEISNIEQHLPTASKSAQKQLQSDLKSASEQRNTTARELGEEKETFYREIDRTSGKTLSSNSDYTARYHDFSTALYKLKNSDEAIVETNLENSEKSELALLKTMLPNVDSDTRSILQPIHDKLEEKYSAGNHDADSHDIIADLKTSADRQNAYEAAIAEKGDEISNIEQHLPTASKSAQKQLQSDLKSASEQRNTTVRELGEEKETFYREIDRTSGKTLSSNSDYTARYHDFNTALYKLKNSDEAIVETNLENSEKSELALLKTMLTNVDSDTRSILQPIHDKLEEKYGTDTRSHEEGLISQLRNSVKAQDKYTALIEEKGDEISNIEQHMPTASKSAQKQLQSDLKSASEQRNTTARELGEEKETFYREIDRTSGKTLSSNSDYTARYQDFNTALYKLKNSDEAIVETNLENSEKSELALLKTMLPNVDSDTRSILQPIHDKLEEKYGAGNHDADSHDIIADLKTSADHQTAYEAAIAEKGDEISNIEQHLPTASKSAQKQLQSDLKTASEQRNTTARELGEEKETFYREIDRTSGKTLSSNSDYTARYQDFNTALYKLKNSDEAIVETNLENSEKSELALLKTMLTNVDSDTRSILQPIHDKLEEKYGTDTRSHEEGLISQLRNSVKAQDKYTALIEEKGDEISNIEQHLPTASKSAQKQLQSDLKTASEQRNTTARELGEEKETFYREIDRTSGKTLSSNSDYTARYQDFNTALYKLKNSDEAIVETNLENSEKSELALLKTMLPNVDSDTRSILQPIHDKLEEKYGADTRSQEEGLISQLRNSVKAQDKYTALIEEKGDEIISIEHNLPIATKSEQKQLQADLRNANEQRNTNARALGVEKEIFYHEIDNGIRENILSSDKADEYLSTYQNLENALQVLKNSEETFAQPNMTSVEMAEFSLLNVIVDEVDDDVKSVLMPIYEKLTKWYKPTETKENGYINESKLANSVNRQEQIIRNIEISTSEIESLENRKLNDKSSDKKQIADEISMEESRILDEIQKLAYEKSGFYSQIDNSLTAKLMEMPTQNRVEYKNAYDSYMETLGTMKIGLAFLEKSQADEVCKEAKANEYKLLQLISPLVSDDVRTLVDGLIEKLESKEPNLRNTKSIVLSIDNNVDDWQGTAAVDVVIVDNASVDSEKTASVAKSLSGYSADMYGIYEMPDIKLGLYYRIQIGAFNVHYRMRDFKGLSLIFTEKIPNTNLVRFMTGEFYKYTSARENLPKVRGLGFGDAFIVAYYNGKRISIAEARRLEAVESAEDKQEIPVVIRTDVPIDYVEPQNLVAEQTTGEENNTENGTAVSTAIDIFNGSNTQNAEMLRDENVRTGVYFAVQIGVYKNRRSSSQMFGITPIDYEPIPTGFIRHTYGKFSDYNVAKSAQTSIRRAGISDAFVIAYIDGRKVSYSEGLAYQKAEAQRIAAEENRKSIAGTETMAVVSQDENLGNVEYEPLNLAKGTEENNKAGVSYYVQIGAFSKTPDPEILSVFSKVASNKVHVKFPREELQIYRIGVFDTYEEAQNTLAEARSFGIVDAFIVAFNGDEQISSSDAMRLQNAVKQLEQDVTKANVSSNAGRTSEQKNLVPAESLQHTSVGVEYYVQLGALVHAPDSRSLATYNSIARTTGGKLVTAKNGRFTDYRVGAFSKFADVKSAVETARSLGISDAFVVAFYNGERISVSEAKEKE